MSAGGSKGRDVYGESDEPRAVNTYLITLRADGGHRWERAKARNVQNCQVGPDLKN